MLDFGKGSETKVGQSVFFQRHQLSCLSRKPASFGVAFKARLIQLNWIIESASSGCSRSFASTISRAFYLDSARSPCIASEHMNHGPGQVDARAGHVRPFVHVHHTTDRPAVNAHPDLQALIVLQRAADLKGALRRFLGTL